jgi:hypothetical protein
MGEQRAGKAGKGEKGRTGTRTGVSVRLAVHVRTSLLAADSLPVERAPGESEVVTLKASWEPASKVSEGLLSSHFANVKVRNAPVLKHDEQACIPLSGSGCPEHLTLRAKQRWQALLKGRGVNKLASSERRGEIAGRTCRAPEEDG